MIWINFFILAAIIVFSGTKLVRYSDLIAAKFGLSRSLVGIILLAAVTSLPELVSSYTAAYIGNANLALGDLLGSNMCNIFLLVLLDLAHRGVPLFFKIGLSDLLSMAFGVVMAVVVLLGIGFGNIPTIFILAIYLTGMTVIFRWGRLKESLTKDSYDEFNKVASCIRFLIAACVIVVSGIYLSRTADAISRVPIWGIQIGGTFFGTLFLAITTSLPELSVCVAAAKKGYFDMAVGNLLGSNMFNLAIIPAIDMAYKNSPILAAVSPLHFLSASFVIILTLMAMASLFFRSKQQMAGARLVSILIGATYITAITLLFIFRNGL